MPEKYDNNFHRLLHELVQSQHLIKETHMKNKIFMMFATNVAEIPIIKIFYVSDYINDSYLSDANTAFKKITRS